MLERVVTRVLGADLGVLRGNVLLGSEFRFIGDTGRWRLSIESGGRSGFTHAALAVELNARHGRSSAREEQD